MKTNADGTESQVYPETHLSAVVGLDEYLKTHGGSGGSGGNQSAEVVAARGKYETLGIREDAQDNAMAAINANKVDKTDLTNTAGQINAWLDSKRDKSTKIKRADMDTSSDTVKLGLINLSEEVQSAMAGKAPVIPSVPDGSITAEKFAIGSAVYNVRTRMGETAILTASQNINFVVDTVNKKISYDQAIGVLNGAVMQLITDTTGASFNMIDDGYILFNTETAELYMKPFTDPSNTHERELSLVVGQIAYDGTVDLNAVFDYTVNGVRIKSRVTAQDLATTRTASITWDPNKHANLVTNDGNWYLELPLSLIGTGIKPVFNISTDNPNVITRYDMIGVQGAGGYIVYNQSNRQIYGVGTGGQFSPYDVVIGQVWGGEGRYELAGDGACFLNGMAQMYRAPHTIPAVTVSAAAQQVLVNTDGVLDIDLDKKTIAFAYAKNAEINVGNQHVILADMKFDGSGLTYDDSISIVIDLDTNTIKAINHWVNAEKESYATIVRLYAWKYGHYRAGNSDLLVRVNGQIINNAQYYGNDSESLVLGGDSTVAGFIGQTDAEHHIHTQHPADYWINLRLGLKTDNIGVDGATIYGNGEKALETINANVNWSSYTKYALQIGVNDYQSSTADLAGVVAALKKQLDLIYAANPNIKIYASLPLHSYRKPGWVEGPALNEPNSFGNTLNDYMDALKAAYKEYNIPVLDWRDSPIITKTGYASQTVDLLHPNDHTYMVMGQRIASFIENNR